MDGIALPKPPTVPKFVSFGSPIDKTVAPDMTNTFLLIAIAGGILIVYALSRVIALQRRMKDLEARPPMDDILMRSIIRQEVSALLNNEPPKSIETAEAEYRPVEYNYKEDYVKKTEPVKERKGVEPAKSEWKSESWKSEAKVEKVEPKREVRSEPKPEIKVEKPTYKLEEEEEEVEKPAEEEEEEEEEEKPKKVTKRRAKPAKKAVDLSEES